MKFLHLNRHHVELKLMSWLLRVVSIILLLPLHSISAQEKIHTLYFLGDAGNSTNSVSVLNLLTGQINPNERNSIIFLGDNVAPAGLPDSSDINRAQAESILNGIFNKMTNVNAMQYYIPGDKDWGDSQKDGWANVKNLDVFIDSLNNPQISLLPDDGCPGPVEISLNDEILLVIVDTQWILHPWGKPGIENDCGSKNIMDLMVNLYKVKCPRQFYYQIWLCFFLLYYTY